MLFRHIMICTILAASLSAANVGQASEITIENAWVRSAPPTATILAGYMTLHNHSSKTVILTSATSPAFESAELHRTTMHDGMMHMESVKRLIIKSNGTVKLEPNSYHLMLNKPKQKVTTGDTIPFTLSFDGKIVQVTATVKQDDGEESAPAHHQH